MSTPITTTCVKEAALLALLQKFEDIDSNSGSRGAYATSILMNNLYGLDKPVFDTEIALIRTTLGLPIPEPKNSFVPQNADTNPTEPKFLLGDL